MKYEWKMQEKDLYGAKKVPSLITVPKQNYIMISGKGNPNDEDFSDRVGALYALAYAIKMGYKAAMAGEDAADADAASAAAAMDEETAGAGIAAAIASTGVSGRGPIQVHDFSVYPLEGVWRQKQDDELIKENLEYTIMIRQPDFITEDMVASAVETVKKKKPNPLYEEVRFNSVQGGTCIEILHVGAFDEEPASFEKMDQFAAYNGLKRDESCHREIYLNNAKRVEKSKLKTILRYFVE